MDSITNDGIANVALSLTSPTNPNITANYDNRCERKLSVHEFGTTPNDGVIITPTLSGYTLNPATRIISYLGYIEWTNQNFIATRQTQITVALTSPTNGEIFHRSGDNQSCRKRDQRRGNDYESRILSAIWDKYFARNGYDRAV